MRSHLNTHAVHYLATPGDVCKFSSDKFTCHQYNLNYVFLSF